MAITKTVHKWERIVPVRFARAPHDTDPTISSGTYDANAPEPDDRGFVPHTIGGAVFPVGLDEAIAVAARPETRVRLIRMDMENTGDLFVTSANTGIFEITLPIANAALPSTKEMMIKLRAIASGIANLEIRFGTIAGPIIHQMEVNVNSLIDVPLIAHVPIITGNPVIDPATGAPFPAQSTRSDASIRALIDGANLIYFPYGIRLNLDPAIDRGAATTIGLTNQGMVDDLSVEFNNTMQLNRVANAINAHFVPQIANILNNPDGSPNNPINATAGVATSAITDPANYGLYVADWAASFQVIAHECGHLFNLPNDPTGQMTVHINTVRDDVNAPGTGREIRFDTISRRRLMWSFTNFFGGVPPVPRGHDLAIRDDVGYGNNQPGAMLTIKQLNNDKTDLEMAEVQNTASILP